MNFKEWLAKHDATITTLSVIVVVATFLVKDVYREKSKETAAAVETAHRQFSIRNQLNDVMEVVGLLADSMATMNNHLLPKDQQRNSTDVAGLNFAHDAYSHINEVFYAEEFEKRLSPKSGAGCAPALMTEVRNIKDVYLAAPRAGIEKLQSTDARIRACEDEILLRANNEEETAKRITDRLTRLNYILFGIGSVLTLMAKLFKTGAEVEMPELDLSLRRGEYGVGSALFFSFGRCFTSRC